MPSGFAFPITRDSGSKAARRKTGVLDEPAFGLSECKFAAPQTVIVSERRQPGAERSKLAKPTCSPLLASFSQDPTPHRAFVENKSQTPIRPSGQPSGRSPFFVFFGLPSEVNFQPFFSFPLSGRQRVANFQKLRGANSPRPKLSS
jgi:hypothetical protein